MAFTIQFSTQAVSFVGSRAALGENDVVKWESAGAEYDVLSSPFNAVSAGGRSVTVSLAGVGTDFELRDQGSSWLGNFGAGERILSTDGYAGPLTLSLASPVLAAGLQIQSDEYGGFRGTIEAFDSSSTSLGVFNFLGNSTTAGDDSAIFVGVSSATADISKLVINLTTGTDIESFGVNRLSLRVIPGVPDAGATLLWLMGATGLLALRRTRVQ